MNRDKDVAAKELMVFLISTLMRYREGMLSKKEAYEEVKQVSVTLKRYREMKRLSDDLLGMIADKSLTERYLHNGVKLSRN